MRTATASTITPTLCWAPGRTPKTARHTTPPTSPGATRRRTGGVCTDVIWRAFRHAGYDLKAMVDADIAANTERYWRVEGQPDPNIDFRRVPNLRVFFTRHAESLTTDPYDIAAWQPGDIVTFEDRHIGVISDRRNAEGIPYLIHNSGQWQREEDALLRCHRNHPISGHFRFTDQTETN